MTRVAVVKAVAVVVAQIALLILLVQQMSPAVR